MIDIPEELAALYAGILARERVLEKYRAFYTKWLRYYLDFCHKYDFAPSGTENLRHFLIKLQSKNQSDAYQQQAGHAVSLYYALMQQAQVADPISAKAESRATTAGLPLQDEQNSPTPKALRGGDSDNNIHKAKSPLDF